MLALAATAIPAFSQAHFEVASIRPSQPDLTVRDSRINFQGNRFEAKAATVGDILDMVGGWQLFRVVGGPPWMRRDRYDIEAKTDGSLDAADRKAALMGLLAERFHFESHRATRDVPGVVLRVPQASKGMKQAGSEERYSIRMESGDVIFTAVSMAGVTNYFSQMLRAPVVDETELEGPYDFVLPTSRIDSQQAMSWGDRVREAAEAIGFRLENRHIPLEVTIVDRCDRPTSN
jgi:uncharacterized protein (TIGR03435 family)